MKSVRYNKVSVKCNGVMIPVLKTAWQTGKGNFGLVYASLYASIHRLTRFINRRTMHKLTGSNSARTVSSSSLQRNSCGSGNKRAKPTTNDHSITGAYYVSLPADRRHRHLLGGAPYTPWERWAQSPSPPSPPTRAQTPLRPPSRPPIHRRCVRGHVLGRRGGLAPSLPYVGTWGRRRSPPFGCLLGLLLRRACPCLGEVWATPCGHWHG